MADVLELWAPVRVERSKVRCPRDLGDDEVTGHLYSPPREEVGLDRRQSTPVPSIATTDGFGYRYIEPADSPPSSQALPRPIPYVRAPLITYND